VVVSAVSPLAFIGLSMAIGLRDDFSDAMNANNNNNNNIDNINDAKDALSLGDKIHISFCQS
jgi:hypothetical protein